MPMPGEEIEFDMAGALGEVSSGLGFENDDTQRADDAGSLDAGAGDAADGGAVGGGGTGAEPKPVGAPEAHDSTATDPSAPTDLTLEPPKTWRKEATVAWANLPAEVRAEIHKREGDMFKGLEGYKADAAFGKTFKSVLDPYQGIMQQYGIDPVKQVSGLMSAHYTLATGTPEAKLALFQKLANDYKVDLGQLTAEAPYVDPSVRALQTELGEVKSRLSAADAARAAETKQTLEKQIEAFAANPANPHFEEVATDMAILLDKGVCKTLEEAYERAVWANPATRAKEMSRQQAAAAKKAADEAAAKAAAARKATSANVRTSAKSGSAAAPLGSIDDTLQETLAAISSRA